MISSRLDGDTIDFVLVDQEDSTYRRRFEGRVTGNVMEGTARGDAIAARGVQMARQRAAPWRRLKVECNDYGPLARRQSNSAFSIEHSSFILHP